MNDSEPAQSEEGSTRNDASDGPATSLARNGREADSDFVGDKDRSEPGELDDGDGVLGGFEPSGNEEGDNSDVASREIDDGLLLSRRTK